MVLKYIKIYKKFHSNNYRCWGVYALKYALEGDETRHMSILKNTMIKIKIKNRSFNENLKKSWPAKIKRRWIPQT